MRCVRQNIFSRFLIRLLTVIILNVSVDPPDLYDHTVPEDLSYNDIESIVEWVLEDVCQFENAIAEHEDQTIPFKFDKQIQLFFGPQFATVLPMRPGLPAGVRQYFGDTFLYSQNALDELIQPPEA